MNLTSEAVHRFWSKVARRGFDSRHRQLAAILRQIAMGGCNEQLQDSIDDHRAAIRHGVA
jgi:hypothetical protein